MSTVPGGRYEGENRTCLACSTLLILPTISTMDTSSFSYQTEGPGVQVTMEKVTVFMWMFDMDDSCASEAPWHLWLNLGIWRQDSC